MRHNIKIISLASGHFQISGDLTFSNISKVSVRIFNLKQINSVQTPSLTMDLQQLGKIDSAGLALLIEWSKFSHRHKKELRFCNIPEPLAALAKLSYLSDIGLFTLENN